MKVSIEHLGIARIELWDVFCDLDASITQTAFFPPKATSSLHASHVAKSPGRNTRITMASPLHPQHHLPPSPLNSTTSHPHHPSPPCATPRLPAYGPWLSTTVGAQLSQKQRPLSGAVFTKFNQNVVTKTINIYGVQGPHCGPHRLGDWSFFFVHLSNCF